MSIIKEKSVNGAPAKVSGSSHKIDVVDKQNRGILCEGKSYQMGFAFLKKIDESTFETIMPITACKDFLNEVVWTEACGHASYAYGMKWEKKTGLWANKDDFGWMAISILPYKGSKGEYAGMKEDIARLEKNIVKSELLMRHVDNKFKIDPEKQTRIFKTSTENLYVVRVPNFYLQYTYLISLFTLVLRMSQFFDQSNSPHEFLESFTDTHGDKDLWHGKGKKNFEKLVELNKEGKLPKQPFTENWCPHNYGIVNMKFES